MFSRIVLTLSRRVLSGCAQGDPQMQASAQVVLTVDDHHDTANIISEMLELTGYVSHKAYSGLEALRL